MTNHQKPEERPADQLRPVQIERNCSPQAEGSVLIRFGHTEVLCTATVEDRQPRWLRGTPSGWVTAEYGMLPRATGERNERKRVMNSGRTLEIQRLIGRSLRQAVSLDALRGYTVTLDCDVLQADGGTRTAAITGACVALKDAIAGIPDLPKDPFRQMVAGISVGMVEGAAVLDMDYAQDSRAEVDMNLVMGQNGEIIELQSTAERAGFSRVQLDELLGLAERGCQQLFQIQADAGD